MGYSTDFYGHFDIQPPLSPEQVAYLQRFAGTRRMRRNAAKTAKREDPTREAVGLPVGHEGAYFVGETGFAGQDRSSDVEDYNEPPTGQPGLWCQWVPDEDGAILQWDGGEKFYDYVDWLKYLIKHFFAPWGCTLNGDVQWQGEDPDDRGCLRVTDNSVATAEGRIVYDFDED